MGDIESGVAVEVAGPPGECLSLAGAYLAEARPADGWSGLVTGAAPPAPSSGGAGPSIRAGQPPEGSASAPGERWDQRLLVSTVAHELRGPLMALATSAEVLAADAARLERAELRALVAGLRCRALWLQGLVENLLCAATLREGRLRLRPHPLDLRAVAAEVAPVVAPLLAHKRQPLRLAAPGSRGARGPAAPLVLADGRRIGQALVNLLLNASKYSPPATPIAVAVARRGGWVRTAVADRGPGLPARGAGRARLFEPFARGAPPGGPAGGGPEGVGLGLAIVRAIVAAHGGRVGAANRRGGGARVWFDLPALPPQVGPPSQARRQGHLRAAAESIRIPENQRETSEKPARGRNGRR